MSDFKIPPTPTPNIVVVTHVAAGVTEQQLREFFAFCGEIHQFQLEQAEDGDQKALVEFTRESAARTATLLSHASLGGREITIAPYFEDLPPYTSVEDEKVHPAATAASVAAPTHIAQEDKPKLSIMVELLANGYILNERIVERAKNFDEKFGISRTFQQYLTKGKEFDEKYKVMETGNKIAHDATEKAKGLVQTVDEKLEFQKHAQAVDDKYKVSEKIEEAKKYAEQAYTDAVASETAQKVQGYLSYVWKSAQDTLEEAKKKAVEKNPELAKSLFPAPAVTAPPAQQTEEHPEKS